MKTVSEALKIELVDYAPVYKDFTPDEILAASGLLTAKRASFEEMLKEMEKETVKKFHQESTKRGHASLLTTPVFYFWIEGSRFIDFFLTAFPFGSYLMFSSRRIEISMDNIVVPDGIKNSPYKAEYEKTCKELLRVYKNLLKTSNHDQARNILPLGFSSYGFFSFPAQTLLTCVNECKTNKSVPEELKIVAKKFENFMADKIPYIFEAAEKARETSFPFPNIFCKHEIDEKEKTEIIYRGNIKRITELFSKNCDWKSVSEIAQEEILVKAVSSLSIAGWNEVKRHRTVRQSVEPIYSAVERYLKSPSEELFHIPPKADKSYKEAFHNAMAFYEKLIKSGIEKTHAIYIIPHALKIKFKLLLDGYHLFDPFGFIGIRSCTTTHYEVLGFAEKISNEVAKEIPEVKDLLGPKCKLGVCPERKACGKIKLFLGRNV